MGDDQNLTRLIAGIYDAALESERWPEVLVDIAGLVDGRGAGLLARDATRPRVNAHWHAGGDPQYMRLYAETYSKLGPIATAPPGEIGRIVSIPQILPYEEFRRGRFFREWAEPQGWVDIGMALLDKSRDGCDYLGIARDEAIGMVDDPMRRRMAQVVPHVRRALLIGKAIAFEQAKASTFADILDRLSAGIFLVDSDARIVHSNSAATEMLGAGGFLRSSAGRLAAGDAQVDSALRETAAAAASGDLEIGARGIAVPLNAQEGERYVAHMLPLSAGERRRTGAVSSAVAALFVCKAALEFKSAPEVIGRAYNLTPTELRVLLAIVEIGGVPEVAAAFGVAETTVKTHLGRLFEKTGTGRQAELVKLVAGFATPLAG